MRLLKYLILDVREQTDNEDLNGTKDKEIVRYFQDGLKQIQQIIFKNNPYCSYFQEPFLIPSPIQGKNFPLPSDVYADNAVSMVEVNNEGAYRDDYWQTLDRGYAEEQSSLTGWFTRNKSIFFSGTKDAPISRMARVWYFQRHPRWDKVWATVDSITGDTIKLKDFDKDLFDVDQFITVYESDEETKRASNLKFTKVSDDEIKIISGDYSTIASDDVILMGKNSNILANLPEEVESYLMDYVAKRVYSRNNYTTDTAKISEFTAEEKDNIISIFADVGQSNTRTPITDVEYLKI